MDCTAFTKGSAYLPHAGCDALLPEGGGIRSKRTAVMGNNGHIIIRDTGIGKMCSHNAAYNCSGFFLWAAVVHSGY